MQSEVAVAYWRQCRRILVEEDPAPAACAPNNKPSLGDEARISIVSMAVEPAREATHLHFFISSTQGLKQTKNKPQ